MNATFLPAVLLTVLVTSCAGPSREREYAVVTEIFSEPPGARIELNGNYLGETPLTTRIRHHPADKVVMGRVVLRAYPRGSDQPVQTKVFNGPQYPFDPRRDVVPERVFFDLRVKPAEGAPGP